jgi:hypothetical protein
VITVGSQVRLADSTYHLGEVTILTPDGRCVIILRTTGGTFTAPKHLLALVESDDR